MVEFQYQDMFPLAADTTEYRLLTEDHVSTASFKGHDILMVEAEGLTHLAEQAFTDVSHRLRSAHLKQLSNIFDDPESSANDRYVALELMKNHVIAAEGIFPMCQDTGTDNRSGPKVLMRRRFQKGCFMRLPSATCGIRRMPP